MADQTARESSGAQRGWRFLLAVGFGLVLLLLSAGLFATVPVELAKWDAYAAAPACPAGSRSDTCTTTVPATVKGTEDEPSGKSVRYWLRVTERGTDTVRRVRMAGSEPVYDTVRAGDEVKLTYWRGEIRTVRFRAAAQETWESPDGNWRYPLGAGLFLLPFGLMVWWLTWWHRHHSPSPTHRSLRQLTVGLVTGTVVSCAGSLGSMVGRDVREALLITAAAVLPAAGLGALCAWGQQRRINRAAASVSSIVPVPPTDKQCVRAAVLGDVPYRVDGFDHLVLGDGRPATTPDPDGRVARKTVPETLVVRHVRALRPDDPQAWKQRFKYDAAVIECRDGDHAVLIALARRDAPLALGALRAMGQPSSPVTSPDL
ncbi:hypothetical protein HEK616_76570 (plasmid) [Streptomyces nigrescens]|uniref:Large integral membrane protein n=1 Tax=Streptomyces nigrescens TaxID=1920 RepID=A0ABM8A692_STRNI|nr:hypothetical protein [Streptomyces nigrescens]BDM74170.1 hypothetical protein HEK616_76570 [Streptomyces nigrescens]